MPSVTVEEARRRVGGGSALPLAARPQYQALAAFSSAMVAMLDEYRTAFEEEEGPAPSADMLAAFAALPPPSVCTAARTVLKRWLRDEGENELVPPGRNDGSSHWSPPLDRELFLAAEAFRERLKKKGCLLLSKAELLNELGRLQSHARHYETIGARCPNLMRCSKARVAQRWMLLRRFNRELEQALPLVHTGWVASSRPYARAHMHAPICTRAIAGPFTFHP